jgi:hypothetical protein
MASASVVRPVRACTASAKCSGGITGGAPATRWVSVTCSNRTTTTPSRAGRTATGAEGQMNQPAESATRWALPEVKIEI